MGNPQRQLAQGSGSTQTLSGKLVHMHRMDLGPLHMGDDHVAWSVCGWRWQWDLGSICAAWAGLLEPTPCGVMLCLVLMQGEGLGPASP